MQHETYQIVRQMTHTLKQMESWIGKVEADAAARKYDANHLLQARLAPDMFPLIRQFGSACDNAKLLAARTTGKTAPSHPDNQQTWAEMRTRMQETLAFLADLTEADFANAAATRATFPWYPGKWLDAQTYVWQYALPNFHFHASMAYAILRENGINVGKGDFLGQLNFRDV